MSKDRQIRNSTLPEADQQRINPKKNFLLKRAKEIVQIKEGTKRRTLYLLHNGIYAVHVRYKNKCRPDELKALEQYQVITEFKIV